MIRRFLRLTISAMLVIIAIEIFIAPIAAISVLNESARADDEPILIWYHHTTREFAKLVIIAELKRRGISGYVRWKNDGYEGKASVAMGVMLNVSGYITDDEIIVEKCGGTLGSKALSEVERVLSRLFPLGDYRDDLSNDGFIYTPRYGYTNDANTADDADELEIPGPIISEPVIGSDLRKIIEPAEIDSAIGRE